jgi:MOSC domain-containing protein YiiM
LRKGKNFIYQERRLRFKFSPGNKQMEGKILSVCISSEKGTKKKEVQSARLITDWGLEKDAHAGHWRRQVSLLSAEEIEKMRRIIPELKPGDFAENLITQGVNLSGVVIGDQLEIGNDIILEVSQIGKECHLGCEIQKLTGDCIMPKKGIFARVLKGGDVEKDSHIKIQRIGR